MIGVILLEGQASSEATDGGVAGALTRSFWSTILGDAFGGKLREGGILPILCD